MIVTMTVINFFLLRFEEAVELKKYSFVLLLSGDVKVTFLKPKI